MILLVLLWFLILSITFLSGLALGSALCNLRWAEKCARCQSLYDRCSAGVHLHQRRP